MNSIRFRDYVVGYICALCLSVLAAAPALAQTVTLTPSVTSGAGPLTLSLNWNTSPAALGCTASGPGFTGTKGATGTQSVTITSTSSFRLDCVWPIQSVITEWVPPTAGATPTGYEIYTGRSPGALTVTIPVSGGTTRTATIPITAAGTHYFAIATVAGSLVSVPTAPPFAHTAVQPSANATAAVTVTTQQPQPPTEFRVRTAAVASLAGMSPVYTVTARNEVGTFVGLIPAGRDCMKDYPVKGYRDLKFFRVAFNPSELWVAPPAGVNVAAACA